jgi:AcrR family transcriptional regulator
MPNVIRRAVRSAKRRIKRGLRDGRSYAIYDRGTALLAQYDCDDRRVSVARIAKAAGVSVGAFYLRYKSKDRFIEMAISDRFRGAGDIAKEELSGTRWRRASTDKIVRGIVRHVVTKMGQPRTVGLTRAAFKLAPKIPFILEPIQEYRATIAQGARELLERHLRTGQSPRQIDAAVQVIFATVIDAALEKPGPLKSGGKAMTDALGDMMLLYLEIAGDHAWSGEKDGEEVLDDASSGAMGDTDEDEEDGTVKVPDGHIPVVDPDLRRIIGSITASKARPRTRRARRRDNTMPKAVVVSPEKIRPAPPVNAAGAPDAPRTRRKRTIRLI